MLSSLARLQQNTQLKGDIKYGIAVEQSITRHFSGQQVSRLDPSTKNAIVFMGDETVCQFPDHIDPSVQLLFRQEALAEELPTWILDNALPEDLRCIVIICGQYNLRRSQSAERLLAIYLDVTHFLLHRCSASKVNLNTLLPELDENNRALSKAIDWANNGFVRYADESGVKLCEYSLDLRRASTTELQTHLTLIMTPLKRSVCTESGIRTWFLSLRSYL